MRLLAALALVACGSKASREEPVPPTPPPTTPVPADAPAVAAADAAPLADVALPAIATEVPIKAADLQQWLVAAHYKAWSHESKDHSSDGPHGDTVRTFISPSLASSFAAKRTAHPKGAAAVKELYEAGKHSGWAVSVKVADDSAAGNGWYWYEVFSTKANAKAAYQGKGTKLCRECHESGGTDLVLIPYPLQ
jgi:hypothetical protein